MASDHVHLHSLVCQQAQRPARVARRRRPTQGGNQARLADLDPDQAAATIIERTLRYGSRAELRWLFHRYPESTIADWVRRWGAFALPKPHLAFWRLLLDLGDRA